MLLSMEELARRNTKTGPITMSELGAAGIGTPPQLMPPALSQPRPSQPMQAAPAPQQRQGLLSQIFSPDNRDRFKRLAIGLEGMTMNPNQGLIGMLQNDLGERKKKDALNRTADVIEQIAPGVGALIREGLLSPSDAIGIYRDKRSMDIAKQASDALARGDTATAYALSLQLSPQAAGQAIAQQYGPRAPEVTGGGMYTVTYENGVPKITVNQDVQNAELARIQAEAEARKAGTVKQPPTAVIKAEEDDFAALDTIDQLNQGLDTVIQDFGYDPTTNEFKGPLADGFGMSGSVTGAIGSYTGFSGGASETARARERYDRWKTSYVNDSLQLNKGVQTEGDAQRAAAELQGANTAAAAYAALQDLVRINQRARALKERAITGRRERYGLDPAEIPAGTSAPDLGWRVVE